MLSQLAVWGVLCLPIVLSGCGTTKNTLASDQLIESDAVDIAISNIDFSPLAGQKIFLDTTYLQDYKGIGFVNSSYIIAGLRQQIIGAGCLLQPKQEDAEYILEGRVGALGSDRHELVYGLPQSNMLSTVGSLVPGAPPIPPIPEISIARKADVYGAAKIALIAYDRESRERVWQSGTSLARSDSKNTWLLGVGPIQKGSIYRTGARFAGSKLPWQFWKKKQPHVREGALYSYQNAALFNDPKAPITTPPAMLAAPTASQVIQQASSELPAVEASSGDKPAPPAAPAAMPVDVTGSEAAPKQAQPMPALPAPNREPAAKPATVPASL